MPYKNNLDSIDKIKIDILKRTDCVFIASVLFSLRIELTDTVPTAATDGLRILFNPKFFEDLDHDERVFLCLHEAYHVVLSHLWRRGDREPRRYNCAGDYIINQMLVDQGFKMIEGGLLDSKYKGMSTEEVYNLLEDEDCDPDHDDLMEPAEGSEDEAKEIIMRASNHAEQSDQWGSIPEEIKRLIEEINNPKLDWRTILYNYMSQFSNEDYSWSKPRNLFMPQHYLPSMYSESMGEIVIFFDCSGSMHENQFKDVVSEGMGIRSAVNPSKITFVTFNTQIVDMWSFDKNEYIDMDSMEYRGGGGTNIECIKNYIEKEDPELVLIMTDGYFSKRDLSMANNLLWLIHSNPKFTYDYGEVIHYEY